MNINPLFYKIWFAKSTQDISIVAPPSYDNLKDADKKSPNYSLLDRLGDRDTVYTMGKLLSRKYPNTNLHLMSSEDAINQGFAKNFVIIGGPGGKYFDSSTNRIEYFQGNELCRVFSDKIRSKISYSEDCEAMNVAGISYDSKYDRDQYLIKDYGYFTSCVNPFYKKGRVILIHGIHTLGVMGAARVLDGVLDSVENFSLIQKQMEQSNVEEGPEFEAFFEVDVTNAEIVCPILSEEKILWLYKEDQLTKKTSTLSDSKMIKEEILQIAQLALNEAELPEKMKELNRVKQKIDSWHAKDIENLKAVYNLCLRNKTMPGPTIEEIGLIIERDDGS